MVTTLAEKWVGGAPKLNKAGQCTAGNCATQQQVEEPAGEGRLSGLLVGLGGDIGHGQTRPALTAASQLGVDLLDHRAHAVGAIRRDEVHGKDFGDRMGLGAQFFEQAEQQVAAIPNRDNNRDPGQAHENRFFTRNHRFWNPSRQGFSLISPNREV